MMGMVRLRGVVMVVVVVLALSVRGHGDEGKHDFTAFKRWMMKHRVEFPPEVRRCFYCCCCYYYNCTTTATASQALLDDDVIEDSLFSL